MNPTEEIIIADPVIEDEEINPEGEELTQEDIDNLPEYWEGEDPFDMCDECKRLGYCKRELVLEDSTITNMIPLRADGDSYKSLRGDAKWYLQAAFDAFHQHDYETAILHGGKILIEIRERDRVSKELSMAFLVLAVCQYFFRNYRLATKHYEHYLMFNPEYVRFEGDESMEHFIWHCENLMNKPA